MKQIPFHYDLDSDHSLQKQSLLHQSIPEKRAGRGGGREKWSDKPGLEDSALRSIAPEVKRRTLNANACTSFK